MSKQNSFFLADSVSVTEVNNELVLLDFNTGQYFGLNHVGADFIQFNQDGLSLSAAIEKIANKYDTESMVVREDLEALITQLKQQKLIIDA